MIADYFNYAVPMTERWTAVSLFAGVGGFDLALERNGVDVVASAEIDKHARAILAKQFPNQKQFDDVRKVNANELRDAGFIPKRGIITGGFPCQDLSVAGKRAGLAGARSGLFYEIARIADETKAKWLVLENVPGLLSSQQGADMGAVIGTLVDLGYGVAWRVLDAQHFGVPQRRRRVFIVAERAGDPTGPAEVLFKRQSLRGNTSTSGTPRQETARLVGSSVTEPTLYEPHHGDGRATTGIANTLAARMGSGGNNTPVLVTATNRGGQFGQYAEDDDLASTLMARDYKDAKDLVTGSIWWDGGETAASLTVNSDNQRMPDKSNFQAVIETYPIDDGREIEKHQNGLPALLTMREGVTGQGGRGPLIKYDQSLTLATGNGQVLFNEEETKMAVRRLTPTECERLQGFPDGWTEGQADSHRYKQMGNAVAVPVVEWVIQGIMEVGR